MGIRILVRDERHCLLQKYEVKPTWPPAQPTTTTRCNNDIATPPLTVMYHIYLSTSPKHITTNPSGVTQFGF